jgi:hypothetical protein
VNDGPRSPLLPVTPYPHLPTEPTPASVPVAEARPQELTHSSMKPTLSSTLPSPRPDFELGAPLQQPALTFAQAKETVKSILKGIKIENVYNYNCPNNPGYDFCNLEDEEILKKINTKKELLSFIQEKTSKLKSSSSKIELEYSSWYTKKEYALIIHPVLKTLHEANEALEELSDRVTQSKTIS